MPPDPQARITSKARDRKQLARIFAVAFAAALIASCTIALPVALVLGNQAVDNARLNAQHNCETSQKLRPASNEARAVQRGELRTASQLLGDTPPGRYYGRLLAQVEYLPNLKCDHGRQISIPLTAKQRQVLEEIGNPPRFEGGR